MNNWDSTENTFINKQSILFYENKTDRPETVVRCFYHSSSTISRMMLRTRVTSCNLRLWSFFSSDVFSHLRLIPRSKPGTP